MIEMRDYRQKIVNVGCMGKFFLNYYLDGDWEIIFQSKDGRDYLATAECENQFFPMVDDNTIVVLPEWMWKGFMNDINTLWIEVERDSIHTPYTVGTA
jgi:hypothetical protein